MVDISQTGIIYNMNNHGFLVKEQVKEDDVRYPTKSVYDSDPEN